MNQILVTEKLYITPELKKKKSIYKIEFILSLLVMFLLFSYYIYAEYDRSKSEQVSKQILTQIKYKEDSTIKSADDDVIIVVLDEKQSDEKAEDLHEKQNNKGTVNSTYVAEDGQEYTTEAVLNISKYGINYPVLTETSEDLLWISLNKYWGPQPNEVGNYCIVGHYYENGKMFGNLHKMKNGDIAELTDLSGKTVKYQVYNKYIVEPTDTRCTSQLTNGKKELTLITCTNHGKQRLVVKCREI